MRIPADRPGYDGYTCEGIPQDTLPPADCSAEPYYKLPSTIKAWVSESVWENLIKVELDSRLVGIKDSCDGFVDPFDGVYADMYRSFVENGYAPVISDNCYPPDNPRDPYGVSVISPFILGKGCGGGGGGGENSSNSSNSSTGESGGGGSSTPTCSYPTLYLRISFSGEGTLDAFGYTWSSGDTHLICPDEYSYSYSTEEEANSWRVSTTIQGQGMNDTLTKDLDSHLTYKTGPGGEPYQEITKHNDFKIDNHIDASCVYAKALGPETCLHFSAPDNCCGPPPYITDAMRNTSYTTPSGVVFAWSTGLGAWPH